jgi:hypothetical protein
MFQRLPLFRGQVVQQGLDHCRRGGLAGLPPCTEARLEEAVDILERRHERRVIGAVMALPVRRRPGRLQAPGTARGDRRQRRGEARIAGGQLQAPKALPNGIAIHFIKALGGIDAALGQRLAGHRQSFRRPLRQLFAGAGQLLFLLDEHGEQPLYIGVVERHQRGRRGQAIADTPLADGLGQAAGEQQRQFRARLPLQGRGITAQRNEAQTHRRTRLDRLGQADPLAEMHPAVAASPGQLAGHIGHLELDRQMRTQQAGDQWARLGRVAWPRIPHVVVDRPPNRGEAQAPQRRQGKVEAAQIGLGVEVQRRGGALLGVLAVPVEGCQQIERQGLGWFGLENRQRRQQRVTLAEIRWHPLQQALSQAFQQAREGATGVPPGGGEQYRVLTGVKQLVEAQAIAQRVQGQGIQGIAEFGDASLHAWPVGRGLQPKRAQARGQR